MSLTELRSELEKYDDKAIKKNKRYYEIFDEICLREFESQLYDDALRDTKDLYREVLNRDGKDSAESLDYEGKILAIRIASHDEVDDNEIFQLFGKYKTLFGEYSKETIGFMIFASTLFMVIQEPFTSFEFFFKAYNATVALEGALSDSALDLLSEITRKLSDYGATSIAVSLAEETLAGINNDTPIDNRIVRLYDILSYAYKDEENSELSIDYKKKAAELSEKLNGSESPITIDRYLDLASLYISMDEELDEAKRILDSYFKKSTGINRLSIKELLAFYYMKKEKMDDAIKMQEEVVKSRERKKSASSEDMMDYLDAKSTLANFYSLSLRKTLAIETENEILSEKVRLFGPFAEETLDSMEKLARYLSSEKPEDAIALFRQIVDIRANDYGKEDPMTMQSEYNMAITLAEIGNYEEALEILRRHHRVYKKYGEEDFIDAIKAKELMAEVYSKRNKRGDTQRAINLYEEALEILLRNNGPDFPLTVIARDALDSLVSERDATSKTKKKES